GIAYFKPSLYPEGVEKQLERGTMIPNSAGLFDALDFVIAGTKVALVRSNNAVSIFDTATGTLTDISPNQIELDPFNGLGLLADGDYVVTVSDGEEVTDGRILKLIDVSGETPALITFPNVLESEYWEMAAIDAESMRVAGLATNGDLYVFDIGNPDAAPVVIDLGFDSVATVSETAQMQLEGDYVLFHDISDIDPAVILLNLSDSTMTPFDFNATNRHTRLALNGGSFAYFLVAESADREDAGPQVRYRSAIGTVDNAPSATLAAQFDDFAFRTSSVDLGMFEQSTCLDATRMNIGYGISVCITPDGQRWFLAGNQSVDRNGDHLQMSTGGAFTDFEDPEGSTVTGSVMAADVKCSSTTVVFRAQRSVPDSNCLTDDHEYIGFIQLDRLAD
ncbi:MAG: hypothetical protein KIS95_14235, partial [Anaerolineae bacterium]|nr:hypothetical protein [Anaerolineae bacterium]